MKKTIKLIFCLGSLMSLLNINATKNNDFLETTLLDNNEKISLIGKRNAVSESLETSKMFTQAGLKDGDYYLRFATAIKVNGNLDNISTLNYTRIIEDNTRTAKAETVYYGISSGEKTYYYNGSELTDDVTFKGQYLWTCYTIKFKNASVSNYLEKNIQLKLFINGKEEATTTTTLLENMNKFSFEAESDSVTYKDCANVPEWGGISQNYKIGGQTGIKVENGNKGASFTFNINSEYETYLATSVYVTPFKSNGIGRLKVENENQGASFTFNVNSESDAEANLTTYVTPKQFDYFLQDGYSLLINGLEMKYDASIIKTPGKDADYDGSWAKYFVEVKIGKIKLVKGNNTITFVAKNTAGLIIDKIILTANTPISEVSK